MWYFLHKQTKKSLWGFKGWLVSIVRAISRHRRGNNREGVIERAIAAWNPTNGWAQGRSLSV